MFAVMKKTLYLWLLVSLWGCTIGSPDADVAHKIVDDFYHAQQQQNVEKALEYFADKRSPEAWRAHLEHVIDSLGQVESFEFKKMEVNTVLSGRFYIFEYKVGYSSGKVAGETLTLFDTVETDDQPRIVSHVIAADGYKALF